MRIAIDTRPLHNDHIFRGAGRYAKNLIEALQTFETEHSYQLFDSASSLPKRADLIHFPYFDPFYLTLPFWTPCPSVVTVHDVIPLVYPEHFPKGIRGSIKWEIQKISLKRIKRIITDSQCSKKDIIRLTGIEGSRIDVIYLASSLKKSFPDSMDILKKRFNISGEFFLFVGDVNWNKNIQGLIQAYALLKKTIKPYPKLVCVGKAFLDKDLEETQWIYSMIKKSHMEDDIVLTGYMTDEDMSSLYRHAQALIQPSWYEGFGFPVLEAMSLGCPVICANSSSLKEIAGPSLMINPNDSSSITEGMKLLIGMSESERKKRINAGRSWADTFSWKKVAHETIAVYEKILGTK